VVAQKKTEAKELCSKAQAAIESGEASNAEELTASMHVLAELAENPKAKVKELTDNIKNMQSLLSASGCEVTSGKKEGMKSVLSSRSIRLTRDIETLDLPPQARIEFPNVTAVGKRDITNFHIIMTPNEGYWKGGSFVFTFEIPPEYNFKPPKVTCITRIYHPNIDTEGHVCLNILREDWSAAMDINACVNGLNFLFYAPNPEDPLNKEAAQLMVQDERSFERQVKRVMQLAGFGGGRW
jgi:ubiquitin-conjugating enzyme E2 M